MFSLAGVRSAAPLHERRLAALAPLFNGFINDALLQLSPDTDKVLLQIIDASYMAPYSRPANFWCLKPSPACPGDTLKI